MQRLRTVVVQQLQRLTRLQGIEAGEDRGVTLARCDIAQVENVRNETLKCGVMASLSTTKVRSFTRTGWVRPVK